jgi:type IV pilus secretin PilQ/predicted competence protein
MSNNIKRSHGSRGPTPARTRSAASRLARAAGALAYVRTGGALLLLLAGLWAAGLTGHPIAAAALGAPAPLDAFGEAGAPGQAAAPAPRLKGMSASAGRRITTISIETTDPVAYVTSRPDPLTLFVDLRDVDVAGARNALVGAKGIVSGAAIEETTGVDGARVARVRIRLTAPAAHQVRSKRNVIHVDFDSAFPLGSVGNASAVAATTPASSRFATMLENVRAEAKPTGAAITLTGNGELIVESVTPLGDGTPRVVLAFPNVRSQAPADVFVGRGPVSSVHVATTGAVPTTRVTVALLRPATYRVMPPEEGEKEFTILFEEDVQPLVTAPPNAPSAAGFVTSLDPIDALLTRGGLGAAGALGAAARGASGAVGAFSASGARGVPAEAIGSSGAKAGPFSQVPQQGAIPQLPPPTSGGQAPQRFTGHPVTLDFQGADLRTVLRTFADISGLNIVIDQSVQGAVDVSLHEVPWDQALDIILRDHKLGYSVEGTIVRIAPLTVLADESAQQRKLSEERALSGDLEVLTRPLSYAKAAELTPLLTRTALSARGDIQIDTRTNTIIIRDLASRLQGAAQLIDTLDRPQPQVEIEARIVTTTRDFARRIGVQWGMNGRAAQDIGNTTNLAFPNQIAIGGRTGGVQGPPGSAADNASTAVNLGISTASSAIGLALGSVNGALNLDVILSALEESGNGRILSTPRVSTQNNVPAEITQGVQVPIQTVANNTVTVSFRDAALKLNVTPQITAANTVIMQIVLENSSPDFSRAVAGIPPINTQRAVTSLLVSDGQTSVIGGIYINARDSSNDRTPGLYKIPILGWLFQRREFTEESRELLIFITPRIIKS